MALRVLEYLFFYQRMYHSEIDMGLNCGYGITFARMYVMLNPGAVILCQR